MEFIRAANYTRGPRSGLIDLIVIHDMEAPEGPLTAENVARYFQRADVRASAHYCIDSNSVVQCVEDSDIAWHAPGANHNGIGLEHAGYARQTAAEWLDPYGRSMLELSAGLTAKLCRRYGIPVRFVDAAGLLSGRRGITTHAEVTKAFRKSTHTDPGMGFPMPDYIGMVSSALKGTWYDWAAWRLGEGVYKPFGPSDPELRPNVPKLIPLTWWTRLTAFLAARRAASS